MMGIWAVTLAKFEEWSKAQIGTIPFARLVEISYHNAAPIDSQGRRRHISEMFRFVHTEGRRLNQFQVAWGESLSEGPDSPRVAAQVGIGTAPPDQVVFAFNFMGLGTVSGLGTDAEAVDMLNSLHKRIREMYDAAIISDAWDQEL